MESINRKRDILYTTFLVINYTKCTYMLTHPANTIKIGSFRYLDVSGNRVIVMQIQKSQRRSNNAIRFRE
jgi:hypothetical protein